MPAAVTQEQIFRRTAPRPFEEVLPFETAPRTTNESVKATTLVCGASFAKCITSFKMEESSKMLMWDNLLNFHENRVCHLSVIAVWFTKRFSKPLVSLTLSRFRTSCFASIAKQMVRANSKESLGVYVAEAFVNAPCTSTCFCLHLHLRASLRRGAWTERKRKGFMCMDPKQHESVRHMSEASWSRSAM